MMKENKNQTPDHQAKMVEEKEKEGDELRASIAESNEESEANIQLKRRQTQNNIKVNKQNRQQQQLIKESTKMIHRTASVLNEGEQGENFYPIITFT